jgi:hypothetical protein
LQVAPAQEPPEERSAIGGAREKARKVAGEGLEERLGALDDAFLVPLNGARHASRDPHPDSSRHCLISLRELFGHVLRTLAPDDEVEGWSSDESDFHDGRPTRGARLRFLYSRIEDPHLREFVEADVKATVKFADLLNKGTHQLASTYEPHQLQAVVARCEGLLLFLLSLQDSRRSD